MTRAEAMPGQGPLDRARVATLAVAIAAVSIVGLGLSLSIPLLSIELERRGVSSFMNGLITAFSGLATILVAPLVPGIAARFGVRATLFGSVLVGAATLPVFLIAPLWAWFPLKFLLGSALCALFVLSEFWINEAAPEESRGLVVGVYMTVLALGFAAGPVLLSLVGTEGWPPYLWGAALFASAAIPLLLTEVRAPELPRHGAGGGVLSIIAVAPAATLGAFMCGAIETGAFTLLPVYGLRVGLGAESAALLVTACALGNILLQIPIGMLADRVNRRLVLLACALVGTAGAALLPAAQEAGLLVPLLVLWSGSVTSLYTVGLAHLGSRFSGPELAGANAAIVTLYSAGVAAGPPLIGGGMQLANPQGFAWSMALMLALYALFVGCRIRHAPAVRQR